MRLLFAIVLLFSFSIHAEVLRNWKTKTPISYIYLTWELEDTSTSMTVNYHATSSIKNTAQVFFSESKKMGQVDDYDYKIIGETKSINGLRRLFHRVTLEGLKPATTYYFVVGDESIGFSEEKSFTTLPADSSEINFITGGDMGATVKTNQLLKVAASHDPDFVAIGGDIAYANGKVSNYARWDSWLSMWTKNMVNSEGGLIPIVLAIGNHEVAYLGLRGRQSAPFYLALFSQTPTNFSYFKKKIGADSVIYILDTGHLSPHWGVQKNWLKSAMSETSGIRNKLALYHIPLYPNHRKYDNLTSVWGRNSWGDIFTDYELDLAFENHDHTLKVTYPIKDGEVSINGQGTVFLGDGCWGRKPRKSHPDRWYLQHGESVNHFWKVTLKDGAYSYKAFGLEGETLYDQVENGYQYSAR